MVLYDPLIFSDIIYIYICMYVYIYILCMYIYIYTDPKRDQLAPAAVHPSETPGDLANPDMMKSQQFLKSFTDTPVILVYHRYIQYTIWLFVT
jgi:hypothetical protein